MLSNYRRDKEIILMVIRILQATPDDFQLGLSSLKGLEKLVTKRPYFMGGKRSGACSSKDNNHV